MGSRNSNESDEGRAKGIGETKTRDRVGWEGSNISQACEVTEGFKAELTLACSVCYLHWIS